ncbi:hypothetical protein [Psychrobacter piechaudii]|uniref:Lipoprotein n=1 Tax=Psychrobacter piechaudii TaxID=1945521 RepID=A0A1R4GW55_9GAMM|nr:hypothetical protein A1232T_01787 [Psychrobacter piechaudii]
MKKLNKYQQSSVLSLSMAKTALGATGLAILLLTSGCATTELMESKSSQNSRNSAKQVLVEDQLVAFGRPAQALPNMPASSVVIVGEKNSYVLSQGGPEMVNILTNLTPKNIQVDSDMNFYSPRNDGYFQGEMKMSYAKLKDEFKRSDFQFFLQNGGKECTDASDQRIGAQRFCFTVPIKGAVYPAVSNLSLIQSKYNALTKPYPVTIYTQSQSAARRGNNAAEKLVLLPFALAFDVITFPIQLIGAMSE